MDTPKIPTLKDTKKPQVKLRGMEVGVTFFERLRQFKKKDLAFILAGLGTLLMAPLAEHFMMAPETGEGTLHQGWGKAGSGLFGGGGSPYEPGSSGLAPGSAIGGGTDIITPLNVRDPSTLVMGMGATQQPPTNSVAPTTPPPTAPSPSRDDLRDALSASSRGVGEGTKAAKPMAKIALSGSNLRGLGVTNGGSSTSASLAPISSNGLIGNKANAGGGGLSNVRAMPNYKGVSRGQAQGGGGLEALKKAGEAAGSEMNRGAASTALDNAVAQGIPGGGSSFGGGGAGGVGGTDKPFGGNQEKSAKSVGESLAFLKQKAIQDKQIELWAKEQEAGDNKLQMLKMRNSIADAIAGKIGGALGDAISCPLTKNFQKCFNPKDAGTWACNSKPDGSGEGTDFYPGDQVGTCGDAGINYTVNAGRIIYGCTSSGGGDKPGGRRDSQPLGYRCSNSADADPSKKDDTDPTQGLVVGGGADAAKLDGWVKDVGSVCKTIDGIRTPPVEKGQKAQELGSASKTWLDNLQKEAGDVLAIRNALLKGSVPNECGAQPIAVSKSVQALQMVARDLMGNSGSQDPNGILPQVAALVGEKDTGKVPPNNSVSLAIKGMDDSMAAVDSRYKSKYESLKALTIEEEAEIPKQGKESDKTKREVGGNGDAKGLAVPKKLQEQVFKARQDVIGLYETASKIKNNLDSANGEIVLMVTGDTKVTQGSTSSGALGAVMAINHDYDTLLTKMREAAKKTPADGLSPDSTPYDGVVKGQSEVAIVASVPIQPVGNASTIEALTQAKGSLEPKDSSGVTFRKELAQYEELTQNTSAAERTRYAQMVNTAQATAQKAVLTMQNTQKAWALRVSNDVAGNVTAYLPPPTAAPVATK